MSRLYALAISAVVLGVLACAGGGSSSTMGAGAGGMPAVAGAPAAGSAGAGGAEPTHWLCRNYSEGSFASMRPAASCICSEESVSDSYAFTTSTCALADYAQPAVCLLRDPGFCSCYTLGCAAAADGSSCACGRLVHVESGLDAPPSTATGDYVPGHSGLGPVRSDLTACPAPATTCCTSTQDLVCECGATLTCGENTMPVGACSIALLQADDAAAPHVESCTDPPAPGG